MSVASRGANRLRKLYRIVLSRAWAPNTHLLEPPTTTPFPAIASSLEHLEDRLLLSSALLPSGASVVSNVGDTVIAVDIDGDGETDVLSAFGQESLAAFKSLNEKVENLGLRQEVESSLSAQLESAIHLLEQGAGSQSSLTAQLDSFIRLLTHWYNKGKLNGTAHNELLAGAEVIKTNLSQGIGANTVDLPPAIISIMLNGNEEKSVSSLESRGIGVQTIEIKFSEAVNFTSSAVTIQTVIFISGVEILDNILTPLSVTGTGTDTMTITFESGSIVDTWVKVTLDGSGTITDSVGNALDGEASPTGSGRGYIYDADLDLTSGNGTAGGDAVFYVGSLRADFDSDGDVDASDFGLWQAGYPISSGASLSDGDADGDGDVDGVDFGIWQNNYSDNISSDLLTYVYTANASATWSADFDSDGDVDGVDFGIWQAHFPTASGATLGTGDGDGDGDVDRVDFEIWQSGIVPAATASEPVAASSAVDDQSVSPPAETSGQNHGNRERQNNKNINAKSKSKPAASEQNAKVVTAKSKSKSTAPERADRSVSSIKAPIQLSTENETLDRATKDGQTAAASLLYHYGHEQQNAKGMAARSKSIASKRTDHLVATTKLPIQLSTEDETLNIFELM